MRLDLTDLGRPRVVGLKVLAAERPAAVRHPVPLLHVQGIHRHAEAGPRLGGAAEQAQPRGHQVAAVLGQEGAPGAALVEVGDFRLQIETATLQEDDVQAAVPQFAGHGDAGRAGPDDAEVRLQFFSGG